MTIEDFPKLPTHVNLPANDDCLVASPLEGSDHGSADKASAAADKHPTPGGPHHDLCSSGSTLKT